MRLALAAVLTALLPQENPLLDPKAPGVNREAPALFKVKLETSKGDLVLRVTREWAPRGADRFFNLVKAGYFDDQRFYRVVAKFVAQWGYSGDAKISKAWRAAKIDDDPVRKKNARGTVTFAMGGPNSRTAQIFINLKDNDDLDKKGFAPFGEVIEGMEVADKLHSGWGNTPQQKKILEEGNAYLDREFKELDRIKSAKVLE
jgi:peptidyl-prolyl cis-trans isomerase A (cyclophilin A)